MKISNTISIIIFLTIYTLSFHTQTVKPNTPLIQSTCKQTPNYNLCVNTLKSDPRTRSANDVTSLALIMVDILKKKTETVLSVIKKLQQQNPKLRDTLSSCAGRYETVLKYDIPEAIEALQKGDPKFAEDGVADAVVEADACEERFRGRSPLADRNKDVHEFGNVARGVVRQLL